MQAVERLLLSSLMPWVAGDRRAAFPSSGHEDGDNSGEPRQQHGHLLVPSPWSPTWVQAEL